MVKDPTAARRLINDDLVDVTTVSLSADASVTEGENITCHGDITNPGADGAVTVTLAKWCNDHCHRRGWLARL
ncbi:hypothetical protein OK016_19325 [Vibrio chagasii]|nr:hypothetical protein [Vibrio chagasii]